jgi:orotidine-5'-phosphate decarboxylase
MEIITPGIRLIRDNVQDQNKNRVVDPKSAFKNGANAIVIGRSITQGSIKNNLKKLIKSLN